MKISPSGLALLEQREGKRLAAYRDSRGIWTIGVGHAATGGPPKPYAGLRITEAECAALLTADLAPVEAAITRAVTVPISTGENDALQSLGFNIGAGRLGRSSVVRRLNAGDVQGAADAFLLWSTPPELIGRRRAERLQFLRPDAATTLARAGALQHAASAAQAGAAIAGRRAAAVAGTGGAAAVAAAAAHHGTAGLVAGLLVVVASLADGLFARRRAAKAATLGRNAAAHLDAHAAMTAAPATAA